MGPAVVESPNVPEPTREVLTAESGLDDGLALPAVVGFAIGAGAPAGHVDDTLDLLRFAARRIVLGPAIGVALAYPGARGLDRASEAAWTAEAYEGIALLGLASILFATLILEEHSVPESRAIHACVVVTVLLSIALLGSSAAPLAKRYGRRSRDFA